ncbi:unnamed protein product [Paramecium pentaurelia]|uniref:Uncharacterized protein n=1 Tax=Paramecium pentaurelia TaxID=43138 RepID=A0A8S1YH03_9CILI|nr:unnamed protein product [Paramecium pentaurelia]
MEPFEYLQHTKEETLKLIKNFIEFLANPQIIQFRVLNQSTQDKGQIIGFQIKRLFLSYNGFPFEKQHQNRSVQILGYGTYINNYNLKSSIAYQFILNTDANYYNSIKFWQCINKQFSCTQTILEHNDCLCGLSINEQENTVISCGLYQLIIIFEQVKNNNYVSWVVKQKILVDQYGYRISFINQNIFVFQPEQIIDSKLLIYTLNDQKLFFESNQLSITDGGISCYYFFSLIYNLKKNILINKNNNNINVIRVLKQNKQKECVEFRLEQIIELENSCIFGTLSNDGEYLVTWDETYKQIQIRQYQEME